MIEYATLINNGYRIESAQIKSVDLSNDGGIFSLAMVLEGSGWGVIFGGRVIGKSYDDEISDSENGIEYILRIMDVVGVIRFNDMNGKYVRVAFKGWGDSVEIIGNIIENKWFDQKAFFDNKKEGEKNT